MEKEDAEEINQDYVDWQTSVRLAGHRREQSEAHIPDAPAHTLPELYSKDGDAFIQLLFLTFLNRSPSEAERAHYKYELETGTGKAVLAARIRYSTEARRRSQELDLKKSHWFDRLLKMPLVGRVVNLGAALLSAPNVKRAFNSQHQAIKHLEETNNSQHQAIKHLEDTNRWIVSDIVTAEERHRIDREKTNASVAALTRELHQEVKSLRDRQLELEAQLNALTPGPASERPESQGTPVDEDFYIAFENHFRGSESTIKNRLGYYLPLLREKLPPALRNERIVDIGCGRGEWIGLLRDSGFTSSGVDLNEKNIAHCRENGLDASLADGISWLRQIPSRSLAMVSSFHVVEHMTLAQLHSLLIESLRCLRPGGLILLETPNPENLVTAAHRFYTDPSHRHPIPPELLEFVLKYKGFEAIEIHRLHPCEDEEPFSGDSELESRLNTLLYGPQDYAVLARKP